MLIDSNNKFLSQRSHPKMTLIKTQIKDDQLILSTSTTGSVSLPLNPDNGTAIETSIWSDQCIAKTTSQQASQWLTDFLGIECQIVYQPDEIIRPVDPDFAKSTDKVYFSDGFPFLICSQASLATLNQSLDIQIPIQRFRPNLVIANCDSYAEDSWRKITINNITFRLPKPCSRCSVPSIDCDTAETNKEPLIALNKARRWNNHIYFGQNALHDNTGELVVGNPVQINRTGSNQPPL